MLVSAISWQISDKGEDFSYDYSFVPDLSVLANILITLLIAVTIQTDAKHTD